MPAPIPPVTDNLKERGYPTGGSFARLLGIIVLVSTARRCSGTRRSAAISAS